MKTNKSAAQRLAFLDKLKNIKTINKKSAFADNQKGKNKEEKNIKNVWLFSIIINLFLIIGIFLLQKKLPPELPLFYGLPEGKDQLVKIDLFILPPLLAIGFSLTHFLIYKNVEDKFIKEVLIYSLLFLSFFSLVAILKVVFLVGNI